MIPFLMKPHWLPVKPKIEFKICLITFKALKFNQPLYIRELLSPVEQVSANYRRIVHFWKQAPKLAHMLLGDFSFDKTC